jgi:hypothetical protein
MKPAAESHRHAVSFAEQYPEQTRKMNSYLRKQGVRDARIEDMVSEAWTRALETFDAEYGLHHVQWAWYILQHNLLPSYGRNRKAGGV